MPARLVRLPATPRSPTANTEPRADRGRQRGGFAVRLAGVLVTLAILIAVVVFLVPTFQNSQQTHRREALQCGEQGLLEALQRLEREPSWREGFRRSAVEGGFFEVSLTPGDSAGVPQLTVVSEGQSGTARRRQVCVLRLMIDKGDSVWVQQSVRQE